MTLKPARRHSPPASLATQSERRAVQAIEWMRSVRGAGELWFVDVRAQRTPLTGRMAKAPMMAQTPATAYSTP